MKSLAIALSIIVLLAVLSSCFSVLAQPARIPHEDPALAGEPADVASLLLFYGEVFNQVANQQYQDAQSRLTETEYANIPDELRYIINRYNTLSRQLLTTLDNLESLLDEASTSLAHYEISDAKQRLDEAETTVHSAQSLLADIEAATNALGDKLGVFVSPTDSKMRQAYERLENMLGRLGELAEKLDRLRQSLADRYKFQTRSEAMATELSLSIAPASVFVGDSVTASGRLTGENGSLANRQLTLFLDDEPLAITTDADGSYAADVTIPYKYTPTMTLRAEYIPSGGDVGNYLPSQSSPAVVNTSFYRTLLEVSAPQAAYPGQPVTVSGRVSSAGPNKARLVRLLLDNTQLAEGTTSGQFSLKTMPPLVSTGGHTLTATVPAEGRYASVSMSLPITIVRVPVQADIQVPLLTVIPKSVEVSGQVRQGLDPVVDAQVRLTFKGASTTVKTSADGSFSGSIEAPFDLSLVGPQELVVTIEPVEPWYASLQIKRTVFAINAANIGLMLVAFVSLGVLLLPRLGTRRPKPRGEVITTEAEPQKPPVAPAPGVRPEFSGTKGRIVSAYLNGFRAVEKVTGISMAPNATLREFLNTVTPQIPVALKPFTELTMIVERALYSAHSLDENTAARAELLATAVREVLSHGVA